MTGLWRGPWARRRGLGGRWMEPDDVEVYHLTLVEQAELERMLADGWPLDGVLRMLEVRREVRASRAAERSDTPEGGAGAGAGNG